MAAGFIAMPAGPGFRPSRSAGRHTITGAGCACVASVGSGCREMNGPRPGSRGAPTRITSAGHRCRPRRVSIAAAASRTGRIAITISDPTNIRSFHPMNSGRKKSGAPSFPPSGTSPSCSKPPTSPGSLTRTLSSSTKDRATTNYARAARSRSSAIGSAGRTQKLPRLCAGTSSKFPRP
jgi:hypothetical protein